VEHPQQILLSPITYLVALKFFGPHQSFWGPIYFWVEDLDVQTGGVRNVIVVAEELSRLKSNSGG
jgi:hypothetical protein